MHVEHLLARNVLAPARARAALAGLLDQLGERASDALLVASELVTNRVEGRGGQRPGPIRFAATIDRDRVRLEVWEAGSHAPHPLIRPAEDDVPDGGRLGLGIVAALADTWGVHANRESCVWAVFERTPG